MAQETSWRELYQVAMLELDPTQLALTIETAEAAIRQQMGKMAIGASQVGAEAQEMVDALQNLRTLRRLEFKAADPVPPPNNPQYGGAL
jgi:hypothetical protein